MFEKSKIILESTESTLLGFSGQKKFLKVLERLFLYPLLYLRMGFNDLTRPIEVWSIASIVLLIILTIVSKYFGFPSDVYLQLFNVCVWGVFLLISFSTPSSYAFYGVNKDSVTKVVAILTDNNIASVRDVGLLEENIKKIEERIDVRVKFYKWLVATLWGVYILLANFQFKMANSVNQAIDINWFKGFIHEFAYVVAFTIFVLLVMTCYQRASKMLIATIQYACVQQKYLAGSEGSASMVEIDHENGNEEESFIS